MSIYVVIIEFRVTLMAENDTTLTCAKPSYLRMKLWKLDNGVSNTEPPVTGCTIYGPDEETTQASTDDTGNFHFTYGLHRSRDPMLFTGPGNPLNCPFFRGDLNPI